MTTPPPTASQWPPINPPNPAPRSTAWSKVAIAGAIILSATALIVALMRPTTSSPATATAAAPPTYTAAETAAAHKKLCEVYTLAAHSVQVDTHGDNPALATAAGINGAVMLQHVVNVAPALAPGDRAAALALADAYTSTNAKGSFLRRADPALQAAIDDVNAKDARMKTVCAGG